MQQVRLFTVLLFGIISLFFIKLLTIAVNLPTRDNISNNLGEVISGTTNAARNGVSEDFMITGSVEKKSEGKEEKKAEAGKQSLPKTQEEKAEDLRQIAEIKSHMEPEFKRILPSNTDALPSSTEEKALLEKLRERRNFIDTQDRELEMRDAVLRANERKLDEKISELRVLEGKNTIEVNKDSEAKVRYRPLVTMYESMKPKDAARVFDRLDLRILVELVGNMNPRKVADILALMEPASAERLTVALARQTVSVVVPNVEANRDNNNQELELPRLPKSPK